MRIFPLIAIGILGFLPFSGLQSQPDLPLGTWEVVPAPDSLASQEILDDVNPYLGKKIKIKKKRFRIFFYRSGVPPITIKRKSCCKPEYNWEQETPGDFYRYTGDQISAYDKTAPDSIHVLSVLCPGPKGDVGATLYYLREDLLLLSYLGLNCYLRRISR